MWPFDEAARQLGVRPLSEFFSADPAQLRSTLEYDRGACAIACLSPT